MSGWALQDDGLSRAHGDLTLSTVAACTEGHGLGLRTVCHRLRCPGRMERVRAAVGGLEQVAPFSRGSKYTLKSSF